MHFHYFEATKKTSHMLGILLNYLYYMNMFKTDVFKMANDRLAERQELVDKIKYTIEDNRKRQTKAEKVNKNSKYSPIIIAIFLDARRANFSYQSNSAA